MEVSLVTEHFGSDSFSVLGLEFCFIVPLMRGTALSLTAQSISSVPAGAPWAFLLTQRRSESSVAIVTFCVTPNRWLPFIRKVYFCAPMWIYKYTMRVKCLRIPWGKYACIHIISENWLSTRSAITELLVLWATGCPSFCVSTYSVQWKNDFGWLQKGRKKKKILWFMCLYCENILELGSLAKISSWTTPKWSLVYASRISSF